MTELNWGVDWVNGYDQVLSSIMLSSWVLHLEA